MLAHMTEPEDTKVITNNQPRLVIDAYQLTEQERAEFDYIDWHKVATGQESADFFRYKGTVYDLAEFQTTNGMPEFSPLRQWDGYMSDSFFSGIVVRYSADGDEVTVGRFLA
jgi:hypothetical protein